MDFNEMLNTPDTTDSFDPGDIQNNKVYAILACFAILFWIPLVAAKGSAFARYYANQGAILLVFCALGSVVGIIPLIGKLIAAIAGIVGFLLFLFIVINAANGKAKEMPFIGGLVQLIK